MNADKSLKVIITLGKSSTDGLFDTSISKGAEHSTNITKSRKKTSLNLHYNDRNNFLCY